MSEGHERGDGRDGDGLVLTPARPIVQGAAIHVIAGKAEHGKAVHAEARRAGEDRRKIVVLVGCSSTKLKETAPARELYSSTLFRKARAWAEQFDREWAILSALHHIVLPRRVLEPYEQQLPTRRAARMDWEREVANQFRTYWPEPFAVRLVILAGERYTTWTELLPKEYRSHLELPLEGLQVGQRLQVLTRAMGGDLLIDP